MRTSAPAICSALASLLLACASSSGGTSTTDADTATSADGSSTGGTDEASTGGDGDAESSGDGDGGGDGDGDAVSDGLPAGVFGGGPFYHDADTVLPRMKTSGFNTVILWTIHVELNGDLILNDVPLVSNGEWIADPAWPAKVENLKVAPSTVTRVEIGVGSYGVPDFERIRTIIQEQGTGPDSILYQNFAVLKEQMPSVDAINFDDESAYDVEPTVQFSLMLGDLGYKISLVPYQSSNFWVELYETVNTQVPGLIDRVMLQVYAGGANNQPAQWNPLF